MINKDRNGFLSIELKVANMRNVQSFTIYPYTGGDTITIQSDKRFGIIDIRKGIGKINHKNEQNGAYAVHCQMNNIPFEISEELKIAFQKYFWENEGKDGGSRVLSWENKELFSNGK